MGFGGIRGLGFRVYGFRGSISVSPIIQHQLEKKIENAMDTW